MTTSALTSREPARVSPSASPRRPLRAHFALADALRAFAILLVVCSHLLPSVNFLGTIATASLAFGAWGVDAFFVLSGFLLGRPYIDALLGRRSLPSATLYARRRFLRIWPAYAVAVVASFVVATAHRGHHASSFADLAAHLALVHNFFPKFVEGGGNAALWTMAVDAQFYVALPIVAWAALRFAGTSDASRRRTVLTLIVASLAVSFSWRLFAIHVFPTEPANLVFKVAQRNLIGMGMCFGLGGLVAYLQAIGVRVSRGAAVSLCVAGAIVAGTAFSQRAWWPAAWAPYQFTALDVAGSVSVACIIFGGLQTRSRRLTRACESRVVTAFAANAYALYLVHLPILLAIHATLEEHRIHDGTLKFSVLILAVFVPAAAACAYALHRIVETPFLTMKERAREVEVRSLPDAEPMSIGERV